MDRSELQARLAAARREESASPAAAEATLRGLLAEHPAEPLVLIGLARLLHRVGRVGEAIPLMRQAAQIEPKPAVFNDLGSLHLAAGDSALAIGAYEAALRVDPDYLLARLNLADMLSETGRVHEAIDSYREVLARDPTSVDAQVGMAVAMLRAGQYAAAIAACEAALKMQPGHIPALHAMAIALGKSGDKTSAIATEQQALTLNPRFAKGWHALGNFLDETGEVSRAEQAYARALELEPGMVEAAFDLAALSGRSPPPVMPRPYVARLFDDFAASFERRLVAELDYRVPKALRQAVAAHLDARGEKVLNILDLGCGTGLVGKQFRDVARSMTGVDLSAAMLAEARAAGIYDELVCADAVDYMRTAAAAQFDLILAADLFIYIGDLEELFSATGRVMRPGGYFAFSIETIEQTGFVLRRTRRYAHSTEYIGALAARHQFTIHDSRGAQIRRGEGGPVEGRIIVLRSGD
jgi:predicted TPR repeat methyltransferase